MTHPKFQFILLSLVILFSLTACSSDIEVDADQAPQAGEQTETESQPSKAPMTLTTVSDQTMFDDAQLLLMDYEGGQAKFKYSGSTYKLGAQTEDSVAEICANSDKGNHIHMIVDNGPYSAIYETTFAKDIPDGGHEVVAFLGRSYHMSIKQPGAVQAIKATFEGGMMKNRKNITEPRLIYSRPKGTYTGQGAENILVDFYMLNAELGDQEGQFSVQAEINGETFLINEWKPFVLKGLPMGEHTMTLTLLDSKGQQADLPFNPVSRTFTLMQEPATN